MKNRLKMSKSDFQKWNFVDVERSMVIEMKTLEHYMAMSYRMEVVEDKEEGGFVVSYPDLPGCISCGETIESAMQNALDAKKAWIEAALEEGIAIQEPDSLEHYSGQFKLRIPSVCTSCLRSIPREKGLV